MLGGMGFVQFPLPLLQTTPTPLRTVYCCVLHGPSPVDCCFETANSIVGGRVGGTFISKIVIMGVELPFPREVGGGDQSRVNMCTPDGGQHGSWWTVDGWASL